MRWGRLRRSEVAVPGEVAAASQRAAGERPATEKTFVLGLGAQKAGTTWLYKYLKGSPRFAHGYRKEYHVLDSRLPSERWMRERILRQAEEELERLRRGEPADAARLHRIGMYADTELYFDYFAGLLRSRPRVRVTADFTPDHALLPAEELRRVQESFGERRIRTVAVFLVRDPVERIWSQIRMREGRAAVRSTDSPEELVLASYRRPGFELRSRYEHTLRNIDAVFPAQEVHVGFYEELFREPQLRAICDLLGIWFRTPDVDRRANRSAVRATRPLADDVARTVAIHFADTYHAVAERFPDKDLTTLWPHARYVL